MLLVLIAATPGFTQLVNPDATAEARQLKSFLDSIYGKKILSGQMDDSYLAYIQENTGGRMPALMGYDFNGICPSQGGTQDPDKAIDWVKNKHGIAQFQWHWISPNADGDFYSRNFKLGEALADPNGSSYKNMIRDMDLVAGEIRRMQEAGIAILWRPLHEAEGQWFWWGYAGGDACKKLYRLMYDRFVHLHHLNNLIWVWNSYGTTRENWYPGDDVVDIIAYDYPDYSASGSWFQYQQMFNGRGKLFAIGENDKLFDPRLFSAQPWVYFMTWAYFIREPSEPNGKNTKEWLRQVYNDPRVLTLADLQGGPRADAGASQTVFDRDGDGYASVTLDGSASSTDSGAITSYVWAEGDSMLAQGVKPTISLRRGFHAVVLTVMTSDGQSRAATVYITVKTISRAYGKAVMASSTEANFGNAAANAVDGDDLTRWSSVYSDPQWYQIDLDQRYKIEKVILKWEVASAKDYRLEFSLDAAGWTLIRSLTGLPRGPRNDTLEVSGTARYLRMYGTARTTTYGYSLYEFEVYDDQWAASENPPQSPALVRNYPNPFNPTTTIEFYLQEPGRARLDVFNARGQKVSTVVDEDFTAGIHTVKFDGRELACGLYFARLEYWGDGKKVKTLTGKMALIR